MNAYSRRYECYSCGHKGRASRGIANTGLIRCPICKDTFEAEPLFRGNEQEKELVMNEWKETHCQRGGSNPADEVDAVTPEEFIMGRYYTKEELLELLNTDSRVVFTENLHEDGFLYIKVKFEENN